VKPAEKMAAAKVVEKTVVAKAAEKAAEKTVAAKPKAAEKAADLPVYIAPTAGRKTLLILLKAMSNVIHGHRPLEQTRDSTTFFAFGIDGRCRYLAWGKCGLSTRRDLSVY